MEYIKPFSKLSISTELRNLMIANEELTALIENKIYPCTAPETTKGDFILYQRAKGGKVYTDFGAYNENFKVAITVVSDKYPKSLEIVELVNDIIEGEHLNKDNYKYTCTLSDSTEYMENKKYVQILLFDIK